MSEKRREGKVRENEAFNNKTLESKNKSLEAKNK